MSLYTGLGAKYTPVSSPQASEDDSESTALDVTIFQPNDRFPEGGPFSLTVCFPGELSLQIWALPTWSVSYLTEYIHEVTGIPPAHLRFLHSGRRLCDEQLLIELDIRENDEITAFVARLGGGPEARRRGIAQVIQDWDGIIPVCNRRVQKLFTGDVIEVHRVIDEHWLEGTNPATPLLIPFYFPKAFVVFTKIDDPNLESQLRRMDPNFSVQENLALIPSENPKSRFQRLLSRFRGFPEAPSPVELQSSTYYHSSDDPSAPSQIPLPPPPKNLSIYDRMFRHLRVAMFLCCRPDNTLAMNLSLISTPSRRVRDATIRLTFQDGVIIDMQPAEYLECTSTITTHSRNTSTGVSSSIGAAAPLIQPAMTNNSSTSSRVEFTRKTSSSVVGSGIQTSTAYWILREDPGEGGRHGLAPHFEMSVRLSLPPVSAEYEVKATIVTGEAVTGNLFNTRSFSSGKKRVYF